MSTTDIMVSFKQMLDSDEISPAEQVFIDEYVATLNKSASFKKAFPDHTVDLYGSVNALLEKPIVKEQISTKIQKNLDGDIARSPAMLLKYTEKYLNLDILDFYTKDGKARPLDEIDPEKRCLVGNLSLTINNKTGTSYVTYTLPNKEKALDRLESIIKLLVESRKVVGNEFADEAQEAAKMRDKIFNGDDDTPVNVSSNAPKEKKRGGRTWSEEQKEEARQKWIERNKNKIAPNKK